MYVSAPNGELTLSLESSPAGSIVLCSGKITTSSVDFFLDTVRPLIPGTHRIALDLSALNFIDSSGLGAIVRLWAAAKTSGSQLSVINVSQRVKDLFRLTNLHLIFEGHEPRR
jgi:anti-sigma B factor antagonist